MSQLLFKFHVNWRMSQTIFPDFFFLSSGSLVTQTCARFTALSTWSLLWTSLTVDDSRLTLIESTELSVLSSDRDLFT